MTFHRALGQIELAADQFVGLALHDQAQHVHLTLREPQASRRRRAIRGNRLDAIEGVLAYRWHDRSVRGRERRMRVDHAMRPGTFGALHFAQADGAQRFVGVLGEEKHHDRARGIALAQGFGQGNPFAAMRHIDDGVKLRARTSHLCMCARRHGPRCVQGRRGRNAEQRFNLGRGEFGRDGIHAKYLRSFWSTPPVGLE